MAPCLPSSSKSSLHEHLSGLPSYDSFKARQQLFERISMAGGESTVQKSAANSLPWSLQWHTREAHGYDPLSRGYLMTQAPQKNSRKKNPLSSLSSAYFSWSLPCGLSRVYSTQVLKSWIIEEKWGVSFGWFSICGSMMRECPVNWRTWGVSLKRRTRCGWISIWRRINERWILVINEAFINGGWPLVTG